MARKPRNQKDPIARGTTRAKAREGKKAIVGYFSPAMSETMHDIARTEGTKIQALVGEGLDMLFADRGRTPLNER